MIHVSGPLQKFIHVSDFSCTCLISSALIGAVLAAMLGLRAIAPTAWAAPDTAVGEIVHAIRAADGSVDVDGWVCHYASQPVPSVRLYVAAAPTIGQMITTATTDGVMPDARDHCTGSGKPLGFAITLPSGTPFRYGGLSLFARTIVADGADGELLDGSGTLQLPDWQVLPDTPRRCAIRDLATLRACFASPDDYDLFFFEANVSCTSVVSCCPGESTALMRFVGVQGKVIAGGGHTLRRAAGQGVCPAIQILQAKDVLVDQLNLDEDQATPPCELTTRDCPATIQVDSSHQVKLIGINIYFGKGYVVYVWNTDGFSFAHSVIAYAGIIGLYVGHYRYGPSHNVVIVDSIIARSRANGIALQGAVSDDPANPVLILGNVLTQNHWHGLWPVPGVLGGITSGGQVLVADGRNIRLAGNIVADGECENCKPPQTVTAVEIADQAPPPAGVAGLAIDHNSFLNGAGVAIRQNPATTVTSVSILANRLSGYRKLDSMATPTLRRDNTLQVAANSSHAGGSGYQAVRLSRGRERHVARDAADLPGARVEEVFGLSPAPRPGAPVRPLYRCVRPGVLSADTLSTSMDCDGNGEVVSVLGYAYEADFSGAHPFYRCNTPDFPRDVFLSWESSCEGGRTLGQPGFAVPQSLGP